MTVAMNGVSSIPFAPEMSFFLGLAGIFYVLRFVRKDDADSPRGNVYRWLFAGILILHASLFSLVAWQFSPRAHVTGYIQSVNRNASFDQPISAIVASKNGDLVIVRMPLAAASQLGPDAIVDVTYTTWSHRAVAVHDLQRNEDIPDALLRADLNKLLEYYAGGVAIFCAGLLCYAWIRRRNAAPATVDLADARKV
jgi:hypothetical protein